MPAWNRRGFIAAGLGLAGCARFDRPSLPWLYRTTQENIDQPPLIVIPGAFGSSLRDQRSGREIWPGSSGNLLVSNYTDLELEIDPATLQPVKREVRAYNIFEQGLGRDFYGPVLRTLQGAGGYARCGEPRAGGGSGGAARRQGPCQLAQRGAIAGSNGTVNRT